MLLHSSTSWGDSGRVLTIELRFDFVVGAGLFGIDDGANINRRMLVMILVALLGSRHCR